MGKKALEIIVDKLSDFFSKKGLNKEVLGDASFCFKGEDVTYVVRFSENKFIIAELNALR